MLNRHFILRAFYLNYLILMPPLWFVLHVLLYALYKRLGKNALLARTALKKQKMLCSLIARGLCSDPVTLCVEQPLARFTDGCKNTFKSL